MKWNNKTVWSIFFSYFNIFLSIIFFNILKPNYRVVLQRIIGNIRKIKLWKVIWLWLKLGQMLVDTIWKIKNKRQMVVCQCKTLMLMLFIWAAERSPVLLFLSFFASAEGFCIDIQPAEEFFKLIISLKQTFDKFSEMFKSLNMFLNFPSFFRAAEDFCIELNFFIFIILSKLTSNKVSAMFKCMNVFLYFTSFHEQWKSLQRR